MVDVRTGVRALPPWIDGLQATSRSRLLYTLPVGEFFDLDTLDDTDPFEIDAQFAHLFKHPHLGLEDVRDEASSGLAATYRRDRDEH